MRTSWAVAGVARDARLGRVGGIPENGFDQRIGGR
jgi:hypothetical protein